MAELGALNRLHDVQRAASTPGGHVWLSASAGTGKTQVLTARVLRLLLAGVDPSAILCITFTKAGAAEMAERISGRLARWVRLDDGALFQELDALGEESAGALLERARTLFARVLDAPGGLRIQTIHGFCQSLLGSFPVEAGLAPGFRPLEPREAAGLAREALAEMLVDAERDGADALIAALGRVSLRLGEGGAESFLMECAAAPEAMAALPLIEGEVARVIRTALQVPEGDLEEAICSECAAFDVSGLEAMLAANRGWGTATGHGYADTIAQWLAGDPPARAAGLDALRAVAHTDKRELRKTSAKVLAIEADYDTHAAEMADRCGAMLELRARGGYAADLASALWVGARYADAYAAAKRRAGAVDFDDLIRRTLALLDTPGMGDWVRFKLDRVTDHVLVDESQDTNATQWRIVWRLAEEYFATAPADQPRARTIFTVGDFKQAIFGFQGTNPAEYRRARDLFDQAARDAEHRLDTLSLTQSFRSTKPILAFVDAAIEAVGPAHLGDEQLERHVSSVRGPGAVALWQPVTDADLIDPGEEGWLPDATRALADRVAAQVRAWIDAPLMLGSKGRALTAGDVMILVRKRGELASLLVARLYAAGVPVAGIDRLRLSAPLGVQDLMAAARFAVQPLDDLNLASLLVSPLIGWTQDELYARARRPQGVPLWPHLRRSTPDELAPLQMLLARADFVTPYRFFEDMLSGALNGRRRLLARLGAEARDPIEELVNAALLFEHGGTPTLQGFIDWFDRGDVDVVREAARADDAVRVMTVHGAKGLQAPLVILADATGDPDRSMPRPFDWTPAGWQHPLPALVPRKSERSGPIGEAYAAERARERAEHWRLFYVGMTRAEERLVLAGALGRGKAEAPGDSWWAHGATAMAQLPHHEIDEGGAPARVFTGVAAEPAVTPKRATAVAAPPAALPAWATRPAPQEARPPRPLAPSAIGVDDVAAAPPGAAMRAAAERGRLLHGLFERLPAMAPEERAARARAWLARQGAGDEATDLAARAIAVIEDPAHAAIFAIDGLAEAPISAVLPDGIVVSGTVDRLVVTDRTVRVIDFKTGHVPAGIDAIPRYHVQQMAAYAAALAVIFPTRAIVASLLYTAGPVLFDLDAALLADAKPGLSRDQQSLTAPA